jgi:outer membrane biosynthesis protein TonB
VPHHFSKLPEKTETEDVTESEADLPPPVKKSRPGKSRKLVAPPTSDEDEESEVEPPPKPKVAKKKEVPTKRRIVSDTSDFDDDTDDDYRTEKYLNKAQARLEAVKKIEEQIRMKSNSYASRGLSAF